MGARVLVVGLVEAALVLEREVGMGGMVVTEVEARELQIICHWATFIATAAEVAVDSDAAFCFFPCVVLVGTFWSAMHWRGLGVVSIAPCQIRTGLELLPDEVRAPS